jgi:GntR family transcriptional regulator/MocR family aminotransferase
MAVWAQFDKHTSLIKLSEKAMEKGLFLHSGTIFNPEGKNLNATRMGFASMNFTETEKAIGILKGCIGK